MDIHSQEQQQDALTVAVAFLEWLRAGGPWVLTAIDPESGAIDTFTASTIEEVRTFVGWHNGKRNLYYSTNPTRGMMRSKAKKIDIAAIEYLLSDLDPAENETPAAAKARYRAALEGVTPEPSAIVDSGNGLQVLYRLASPIELPLQEGRYAAETQAVIDDAEGRMAAHMKRLGSVAGTQNIDRILRLPGTINLPSAAKREKGRVECPTALIRCNGAWSDGRAAASSAAPPTTANICRPRLATGGSGECGCSSRSTSRSCGATACSSGPRRRGARARGRAW
jgi:hypothetical protein